MESSNKEIVLFYKTLQDFDIFSSNKHLHDFNFISACIGKLLPCLDFEEHVSVAKDTAFYQMLSVKDEADFQLMKNIKKPNVDFCGKILVTFHYSSYRLFSGLLSAWSIPFKLVADNNYVKNQGEKSINSYLKIVSETNAKKNNFEIINAEDRTVLFKCIEAIKQGYSLLFYADGNSGVGGMTKEKHNLLQIPFLQSSIYVRKGIPTLANLLKLPITTITLRRDIFSDEVEFDIRENIPFPMDRKNEQEIQECTLNIFRNLEDQINKNPGQWEGWFYYHNFMDFYDEDNPLDMNFSMSRTIFNHRFYGIGILAEKIFYVLNKKTLRLTPISEDVFNEILYIIRNNQIRMEYPVFESLFSEGILVHKNEN